MGQYIHEIVLQEYIVEYISSMNISVKYKNGFLPLVEARPNRTGTFWDLEGKLSNEVWIPLEVEWISQNFISHGHNKNIQFSKFQESNGIVLVIRKNKEIPGVQQVSVLDHMTETQLKKSFKDWFKGKAGEYIDSTLKDFMVGNYARNIPRIILYPISNPARKNYFAEDGSLYRKAGKGPSLLGFKDTGFDKNIFVQDLQPNDICVMIDADGRRGKRKDFIERIKNNNYVIKKLAVYRVISELRNKGSKGDVDELYWKDEIKANKEIYPRICTVESTPFFHREHVAFPYIKDFSESTWEDFRSCIQYGEYRELSTLDFTLLLSNL